jgi:hypothetical protein
VSARAGRLGPDVLAWIGVALLVLAGTALAAHWALTTQEWRVMTDELGYVKTAISFSQTWSPVPAVRGQSIHNYGILYPALIAPLVGVLDMPTAFRVAHGLGALLMASAGIPAFMLARFVTRSRAAGLAAAAPVALAPWLLFSMNLLTEVVAYPLFVWTLYASVVAVAAPRLHRDVLLVVALVALFLARTQFIFVFALVPLVIVLHEVTPRLGRSPRRWPAQAWRGLRVSVTGHPLLAVLVVLGGLVALLASSRIPLGSYNAVRASDPFPPGFAQSAVDHLTEILVGVAVVPLALTVALVAENLFRAGDRRMHSMASHAALFAPALLAVATTFDLQFARAINERYVFYLAPVLIVAAVVYVVVARRPVIAAGAGALITLVLVLKSAFSTAVAYPVYASPTRLSWVALDARAGQLGLSNRVLVAIVGLVAAAVVVALLRLGRRRLALLAVGGGVAVWGVALMAYCGPKAQAEHDAFAKQALGTIPPLHDRDWVDQAVPSGATVGMVPSPVNARGGQAIPLGTVTDQGVWWEAEFWNKTVRRAYQFDGAVGYAPYASQAMGIRRATGELTPGGARAPYLLVADSNVRVGLAAPAVAHGPDLTLYHTPGRYLASWFATGLDDNGRPGSATRPIRLTVYGRGRGGPRTHTVALSLSGSARALVVRGPGVQRRVPVSSRRLLSVPVCVPAGGSRALTVAGGRPDALRLVGVRVTPGASCRSR